jgi:hypothetical protein
VEQIKRKRLGSKAWREVLERFAASNESVRQFCGREGLSTETFRRWRTRLAAASVKTTASSVDRKPGAAHFVDLGSLDAEPTPSAVSKGSPRRFEFKLDLGDGISLTLVRS